MKGSTPHITFLDHFRGVAILWVFLLHCIGAAFWAKYGMDQLPWAGYWRDFHVPTSFLFLFPCTLGWVGVTIFFVVSGFCIQLSHQRSRETGYVAFFTRRFFRIYPPYLLTLLFYTFLMSDGAIDFVNNRFISLGDFGTHLMMIHNLINRYCFSIDGAYWSVGVEVQLYALYPLLIFLTARLGWRNALWTAAAIELSMRAGQAVMIILKPTWGGFPAWYEHSPLIYWYSWSVGAALAYAYVKGEALPFRRLPVWLCPVLFFVCYFFQPLYPFCFPLASLSTARVMAGLLDNPAMVIPNKGFQGFFWEILRWSGLVSYSAYLLHKIVLHGVPWLLGVFFPGHPFPPVIVFGLCVVSWSVCMGMSALFFVYIEQPSIALGKRLLQARRAPAPVAPVPSTT